MKFKINILTEKNCTFNKDTNGSLYQSLESNNDLSISYEMIDGTKTVNNIEIHSDNVSLDEIASYTSYTKELTVNNGFYKNDKRKES